MNYVYTYTVNDRVVYVGIGSEDGEKFLRAKNIAGHNYVRVQDYDSIAISIVARKLKRRAAYLVEAILINQHRTTVLNKTSTVKLPQFCNLRIEKSGQVRDNTRKTEEAEFWAEYRSIEAEEGDSFDYEETLRYLIRRWNFVPSKIKGWYDLQTVIDEDDENIKASRYETQNLNHDAPMPSDDPSLDAYSRIANYLNYYAFGEYKIDRIIQLATCKSVEDFCSYMHRYFVHGQVSSKLNKTDEKLRLWFLGHRDKRPKITKSMGKHNSAIWRFERLYHFILLNEQGFARPQKHSGVA